MDERFWTVCERPRGASVDAPDPPATLKSVVGGLPPKAPLSVRIRTSDPAAPKAAGFGVSGPTMPLDVEGARRRYLEALLGPRRVCEGVEGPCEATEGVEPESSRTMYPFEGVRGSPEDPNRPIYLCCACAKVHHEHWDEQWKDYYASRAC